MDKNNKQNKDQTFTFAKKESSFSFKNLFSFKKHTQQDSSPKPQEVSSSLTKDKLESLQDYVPKWKNSKELSSPDKGNYKHTNSFNNNLSFNFENTIKECINFEIKNKKTKKTLTRTQYIYHYSRVPIMLFIFLLVILNIFRQQQLWYKSLNLNLNAQTVQKFSIWEDIKLLSKKTNHTLSSQQDLSNKSIDQDFKQYSLTNDELSEYTNNNAKGKSSYVSSTNNFTDKTDYNSVSEKALKSNLSNINSFGVMTKDSIYSFLKSFSSFQTSQHEKFVENYVLYLNLFSCSLYAPWSGYHSSRFKFLPFDIVVINAPPYLYMMSKYYVLKYYVYNFLELKTILNKIFAFLKIPYQFNLKLNIKIANYNYISKTVDGYYYLQVDEKGNIYDPIIYLSYKNNINSILDLVNYYKKEYSIQLNSYNSTNNNAKFITLSKAKVLWSINKPKDLSLSLKLFKNEIMFQILNFTSNNSEYLVSKLNNTLSEIYYETFDKYKSTSNSLILTGLESCVAVSEALKFNELGSLALQHKNKILSEIQSH